MENSLIELLVPDYILSHFEYESWEEISGVIRIHLVEKKDPNHYSKPSCYSNTLEYLSVFA